MIFNRINIVKFVTILIVFLWMIFGCFTTTAQKTALIPLPQSVRWTNDSFLLEKCKIIFIADSALLKQAQYLQGLLAESGFQVGINYGDIASGTPSIQIKLGKIRAPFLVAEAYQLSASKNKIVLTANTSHGIFNGLQTLQQLIQNGRVATCDIKDWPSFQWRGYMVDVGRNFQSVELIKQQIEIMSRYKLNVFHFHPTEDIAWRIASKKYPQLTAPKNMIRNKGEYYSENDLKDLIQFCNDRFITFVPEIDMPGHSAAFTRTFGADMQSEKGFTILKNIITEFNSTYDVPYLHIGADEVKFTNKNFLPEMISLIHQQGKQTIGWHPGGNYNDSTIRQMWETQGIDNPNARFIDSRSFYLNHMDPLESVVSIFERQICDTTQGSAHFLGGEICLWNDRRVSKESDLLSMNPVYPSMLAFAERSWRGGGYPGVVVNIGHKNSDRAAAFIEFENRLINHKQKYFSELPFPYVRQGNIEWKFFGPFENNGELSSKFWPEENRISLKDSTPVATVTGGTIYMRHWWFPVLTSWLKDFKENTTWYAYSKIWKENDTTGFMWIGFSDFSRSTATDNLKAGTWDSRNSEIRLNGNIIPPPEWKNAGATGNSEVPLIDEGYSYRPATKVKFKKGWNIVMVKIPVKSFKGKDWQNPVKWMFTAIPVHKGKGINWDADELVSKK